MAEALMRRLWEQYGDDSEFKISSAGLAPVEDKASLHVRELLAREGISLESHTPRRLTESQINEARLILVMEEHHRRAVQMCIRDRGNYSSVNTGLNFAAVRHTSCFGNQYRHLYYRGVGQYRYKYYRPPGGYGPHII